MMKTLATALLLALTGCATDPILDEEEAGPTRDLPGLQDGFELPPRDPAPMEAIAADMCDEPTFENETWLDATSDHFTLHFLPGTAADQDQNKIASRLETAYDEIRSALGITAEPHLTVNMSPSRTAAYEFGFGFGRVWGQANRYDVVYTGASDSYEVRRYGQMLTAALDYHLDPANRYRSPVLATGIAEYFDQSGRDLHTAYARQLTAGVESRVRVAELDSKDVTGRNVGRSGSLVKFLIDRYGMESFVTMYRATAVTWMSSYGCYWHGSIGCVSTPERVTSMLDSVLFAETGEHWADMQPAWEATVEAALDHMTTGMAPKPTTEIQNLFKVMDHAINTKDAGAYRTTIEGFYCDWGGDAARSEIALRAVNAFDNVRTQVLGLYDTEIKNFWTAQAFVMRTDSAGVPTFQMVNLEHVPAGWRVSYSPDWY
jgi:hypothetical protein